MMRLKDKVALVTGAETGVGFAVAALFAREGATVFASDRAAPSRCPAEVCPLALDVTDELAWQRVVDSVIERSGRLDVLVNAVLTPSYERLDELSASSWSLSIALNQTGVFYGMREAIGVMRRQRTGAILNVILSPHVPQAKEASAWHAGTGAICSMSKNAGLAFKPDGIRTNAVLSGFVRPSAATEVTPIQVAHACLFLSSDEASGISGAELAVEGSGCVSASIS